MSKSLKDILNGTKSSSIKSISAELDPSNKPKTSLNVSDIIDTSKNVEVHDNRVGNTDDLYKGANIKKASYKRAEQFKSDKKDTNVPSRVHNEETIAELSQDTLKNYKKEAEKDKQASKIGRNQAVSIAKDKGNTIEKRRSSAGDIASYDKAIYKRSKGIATANSKITKEEFNGHHLNEILTSATPAGDWIKDFEKSKNPKFTGKSKEQRKQMALGAYYAKKDNK
jgi:hypothetical protein